RIEAAPACLLRCSMASSIRQSIDQNKRFLVALQQFRRRFLNRENVAMRAFYSGQFVLPLPPGHRFPMGRYALLREGLERQLPQVGMFEAPRASDGELALAHTPQWIASISDGSVSPSAMREIGFPWSEAMVERSRRSTGATIAACRAAFAEGVSGNMAGGT